MGHPRLFAAAAIVFALSFSSIQFAQQRFSDSTAGISLAPPPGWHSATVEQVQANRERTRLADPEIQQLLVTRSALPLVAFMKHQEPYSGINPSIQVTLRRGLPGTATELLSAAIEQMRRATFNFRILKPAHSVQVAGWPAAHLRATYSLKNDAGESFDVVSRLWLIPRGKFMFLIGMSGAPVGEDTCEEDFAAVLSSIDIQK
jgi:hypothetical protein